MVKRICFILAILMLLSPLTVYAERKENSMTKEYYAAILQKELDYFSQLSLPCGAVGMYPPEKSSYASYKLPEIDGVKPEEYTGWPSARVIPYFSDTAVLGAMRADSALGTEKAKEPVLAYINWYISHMNTKESDLSGVAGTVYDYRIFTSPDGRTVELTEHDMYESQYPNGGNPHDYDSTDSYAAMFLQILYEYAKYYDTGFLAGKKDVVQTLVDVMMSVYIHSLDLTIAKPTYPACYLMDNCEVYCGFVSANAIFTEFLPDPEKAAFCAERAEKVKNAISTRMWSSSGNCFLAAVSDNGKSMYANDLSVFYPQASCQLFPVIFGVIDSSDVRAAAVYERFKTDFGTKWLTFSIETYPWCLLVRGALAMGDREFAEKFIDAVNRRFIKRTHAAPYYNSESGSVMIAAAELYAAAPESAPEDESSAEESAEAAVSEPATEEISADASEPVSETRSEKGGGNLPLILAGIGAAAAAAVVISVLFFKKRGKK